VYKNYEKIIKILKSEKDLKWEKNQKIKDTFFSKLIEKLNQGKTEFLNVSRKNTK
jgi:hypothetical protein